MTWPALTSVPVREHLAEPPRDLGADLHGVARSQRAGRRDARRDVPLVDLDGLDLERRPLLRLPGRPQVDADAGPGQQGDQQDDA